MNRFDFLVVLRASREARLVPNLDPDMTAARPASPIAQAAS
jgi:hypothetical protein